MDYGEPPRFESGPAYPRNSPCPCGSGRKYKHCCLAKEVRRDLAIIERDLESDLACPDRFDDPTLDAWKQADRSVCRRLCEAAVAAYPHGDELFEKYLPARLAENLARFSMQSQAMAELFDWAALDYRLEPGVRTVAETMLERPADLTEKERLVLAGMAAAARSLWQVVSVEKDRGIDAEDLLRGGRVFVTDVSLSRTVPVWSISPFRVYPAGPFHFPKSGWACIPPDMKDAAVRFFKRHFAAYRRKRPEAGWDEFLRARAELFPRLIDELGVCEERPLPQMSNTDGEALVFCRAEFSADDPAAALAALDGRQRFEVLQEGGERVATQYGIAPKSGFEGRRVEATVRLQGGRLVLECNSRRRLAAAKRAILSVPGVRHLQDSFKTVEDLLAEHPLAGSTDDREPPPREVAEAAHRFNEQYYEEHWVRERIPALDGKTPLEMAKTARGRRLVEELIRSMEFMDAHRADPAGRYDFNRLRRVLGLAGR